MNRAGRLMALQKNRDATRDPGESAISINLNSPPRKKGWIVVGTFHTHDFDSQPSMPTGETVSLPNDIWTNEAQRVPGIILGGILSGQMAFTPYGPEKGYWQRDLPRKCQ